jgi:geranylgeranyl diphosphate synthase type II
LPKPKPSPKKARLAIQPAGHGPEPPDLGATLDAIRRRVDAALDAWLPAETAEPVEVHRAMRYSLFSGGKRIRPAVCLMMAEAAGKQQEERREKRGQGTGNREQETGDRGQGTDTTALPAACALECIHTYSLIHDDLPAMDDDDLRRGRPTCHVVFGEAPAILAGDALLTLAFELLARRSPPDLVSALVAELAEGAGTQGMVGGQVLDMREEGNKKREEGRGNRGQRAEDILHNIHRWKTAALIRAAARMGAIAGRATAAQLDAAGTYGLNLGLAFQVADDVLDVTGTARDLGKTPGKDAKAGKLTYPAVYGLEASKAKALAFAAEAKRALAAFPGGAPLLAALAELVVSRKN